MKDKIVRLSKALTNESVRRLPYVFVILIVLFLVQFIRLNNQTAQSVRIAKDNSIDSKQLLKQVASLGEDNKKLTQQNIELAKENADRLDCVSKLFARYTKDLLPIDILDLNTCFIQESSKTNATPSESVSQPQQINHQTVSSPNNNGKGKTTQPNTSHKVSDKGQNTLIKFLSLLPLIGRFFVS